VEFGKLTTEIELKWIGELEKKEGHRGKNEDIC
jgi:hypothetical protein